MKYLIYAYQSQTIGNIFMSQDWITDEILSTFDQNEFFDGDAKSGGLDDEGFIHIPKR